MITYQVDENTDSRKFVQSCTRQGLVNVWRFPKDCKGVKDPEVLAWVLASGRTFLTTDRQIHVNHVAHIPDRHSGILIVAKVSSPMAMRGGYVTPTLSAFKAKFPDWHRTSLQNSIVEITESSAEVWKVIHGRLARAAFLRFDESGWQDRLSGILDQNARVGLISDDR